LSVETAPKPTGNARYQMILVAILSVNFGIVFFDRNTLNFLMPLVKPDLNLSNTQVGILSSALSLTWALAAFAVGLVADRSVGRKSLLIAATLAFSLCSVASGIAGSFLLLLGARLLMGVAEGGIMPVSQAIIATEVGPEHRGLAMGVAQNFGSNLLGSFAAPVMLVSFALAYGWRRAFFLAAIPGLVSAVLLWWVVRPAPLKTATTGVADKTFTLRDAFAERNVILCAGIAVLLVAYLVVCWTFMSLFLTQVRGYDAHTTSWLMGTLGISATVGSFAVSGLSDRTGRRPLLIAAPLLGLILPLSALYFTGSVWAMAALFFVGWGANGLLPLVMATVPAESVGPQGAATVIGLCMGSAEIIGGVLAPYVAGFAADRLGLPATMWMMLGFTVAASLLGLGIRETAPRLVARGAVPMPGVGPAAA
jgi:MFS transporter, ACS family, hexuronate transporter